MQLVPAKEPFHVLTKPIGPVCNLKCEYCFYLGKTSLYPEREQYRMSDEVLERLTRQYIECQPPETREVNFAWQGGEPTLMGLDFFKQAVACQKKYARPGMRITNALQTNGTRLTDEWGPFLRDSEFLIGLSLDGPEKLHDKYRKDRRGRGSFAAVMKGLEVLQRHQVEYNALVVVQSDNGKHPREVYDFVLEIGCQYMQFIPIVEKLDDGKVSHRSVGPEQFGRFLNTVFDRWRLGDIGRIYVQHFDLMLGLAMGYPASLCVHSEVCGRNVALEHNGDLFDCDHFVFPENKLGNITQQSMTDMLDGPQAVAFGLDKRKGLPDVCGRCKFLRFCNGGCPAHRCATTPDGQSGWNYLCEGYRTFFTHSLKYFVAMAECLRRRLPASRYGEFMAPATLGAPAGERPRKPGRNAPCPCGSGKKYKHCCAKR